jgi:hypothetical protein
MALSKKPYFIETVICIENTKIRICADENIYACGEDCIASTHNHSLYEIRYFNISGMIFNTSFCSLL